MGRSGSSVWYGFPTGVELFQLVTPQEVRIETRLWHAKRNMIKQIGWTPFEREVMRRATEAIGVQKALHLHPMRMFEGLRPFFETQRGLSWVQQRLHFGAVRLMDLPETAHLPDGFVAAHFYTRPTWHGALAQQFAVETVKRLATQGPVVLLGSGLNMDDHLDMPIPKMENVYTLADCGIESTPTNALAVQSAVLAKAQGFAGTYGGLTHLAVRMRKPSVSFFTEWVSVGVAHRLLTDALGLFSNVPCAIIKLGEVPMLESVMPEMRLAPPTPSALLPVDTKTPSVVV